MTEKGETPQTPPDPFEAMIRFYETWSKNWAQTMSESASSAGYAEAMGRQMETHLETFGGARKQFGDWMDGYLREMNLPTRAEVAGLAERLTSMEIKLDDLDAKLDEILDRLKE